MSLLIDFTSSRTGAPSSFSMYANKGTYETENTVAALFGELGNATHTLSLELFLCKI